MLDPYAPAKPMLPGGMKAGSNYNFAATNVLVWNVVLWVSTAVPTYAFIEAFNHEARWNRREEKWRWKYDYFIAGVRHTAELYGWYEGQVVNWEMYVSKDGDWQDVLWYTGKVNAGGESGEWLLNTDPNNPTPFIQIDWTKNADGTADIRYTNVIPGAPGNGGYIQFGSQTGQFDRFYNIYDANDQTTTYIQWHSTNQEGEVTDIPHFGDPDPHCWDSALENVVCQ